LLLDIIGYGSAALDDTDGTIYVAEVLDPPGLPRWLRPMTPARNLRTIDSCLAN
jgi:hypothetical protein